jgi:hypothetical protein
MSRFKVVFLAMFGLGVLFFGYSLVRNEEKNGAEGTNTSPSETHPASHRGTLLETGNPSKGSSSESGLKWNEKGKDGILERLQKIEIDSRISSAILSSKEPVARHILLYLKSRKAKNSESPEELSVISGEAHSEILKYPDIALPLIGRALSNAEMTGESRNDRLLLLGLVGGFSPTENTEINRSAISTLSEIYSDAEIKPDDRVDGAIHVISAYLASLPKAEASRETANSTLLQAMGGKLDPAIQDVYRGMFSDRFPPRPAR